MYHMPLRLFSSRKTNPILSTFPCRLGFLNLFLLPLGFPSGVCLLKLNHFTKVAALLGTAKNYNKQYTTTRKSTIRSESERIGWISRDHPVCFLALGQLQVNQDNPLRIVRSIVAAFSGGPSPVSWKPTTWFLLHLYMFVVCRYNHED